MHTPAKPAAEAHRPETSAEERYADIIRLSRPVSPRFRPMPRISRAAQFASFDALTGFGDAVTETARITDQKIFLTEDKKQMLDETLRLLLDMADNPPTVRITHFIPDPRKAGGAYVTVTGQITDADPLAGCVVLADKRRIPIGDILDIEM